MKKIYLLLVFAGIFIAGYILFNNRQGQIRVIPKNNLQINIKGDNMKITSGAFENGTSIPAIYTCEGKNINPPLTVSEVPENTRSLVLVVDDPDAPMGTWTHWTLWNIDPETAEIAENSVPAGASQGVTSFGKPGYGGPCPPSGTHRYFFRLYALSQKIDSDSQADVSVLMEKIEGITLASAQTMGTYQKK